MPRARKHVLDQDCWCSPTIENLDNGRRRIIHQNPDGSTIISDEQLVRSDDEIFAEMGERLRELRLKQGRGFLETTRVLKLDKNSLRVIETRGPRKTATMLRLLEHYGVSFEEVFGDISFPSAQGR